MGLLDQFTGLSPDQNQGLLAAAAQMLQASGPSLMPHSFGQVLGAGYQGYQQGMQGVQDRQLGALKMKALQSDLDQKQALLDMQNRIRQRSLADISGQPPTAQAAAPGMPVAPPDPSVSQPMASAMPGGSMSPKTGGPDWLQSYQASASAMPTPTATPDAAPSQAPSSAQAQPTSLTQSVMARLTRLAQIHTEEGDIDGANALYEKATKFMPEVNKIEVGQDPTTGKPINVITYKDGRQEVSQFAPKPEIHWADNGQSTAIPMNGYTGEAMGKGLQRQATPGEILQNRQTAARLAFDKDQASSSGTGPLTEDAINLAADRYNFDGTLPPMGMGKDAAAGRSTILNRAAERKAQGILPGSQRAEQLGNVNDIKAQGKALRDFTGDGKSSQAIQATNTGLNHLETIKQLALAQKSGDVTTFNRLARSLGAQFGQTAPTNLNAALVMVAPEVSKAVVGAGGTGHDRDLAMQALNPNGSNDQILGGINTMQELFAGRLSEAKRTYERSTKRNDFDSFLSPAAQGILSRGQGQTPAATTPTQKSVLKGQVVRGYRFMGGDPSVQSNWEKA